MCARVHGTSGGKGIKDRKSLQSDQRGDYSTVNMGKKEPFLWLKENGLFTLFCTSHGLHSFFLMFKMCILSISKIDYELQTKLDT